MKRFWPELAVLILGLTAFACLSFADGRSCGCANCQCQACPADCPTLFVTADKPPRDYPLEGDIWDRPDGSVCQFQKVCVGQSCVFKWVVIKPPTAKPMPKGPAPAPAVAKVQQTEEPPLAAGPVRTLVAVVWQKARVVVGFVLHPLHHRRHN